MPASQQDNDLFTCDLEFSEPPLGPGTEGLTFGQPRNSVAEHAGTAGFRLEMKVDGEPIDQVARKPGETMTLTGYARVMVKDGAFPAHHDSHGMEYAEGVLVTGYPGPEPPR